MNISIEELFDGAKPEQLEGLLDGVGESGAGAGAIRRVVSRVTGVKKRAGGLWIAAACAALTAAAVVLTVVLSAGPGTKIPNGKAQPGNNSIEMIKKLDCFDRIIWSDSDEDDPSVCRAPTGPALWNGVYADVRLYAALESADDNDVFAVMLRSKLGTLEFEDFVYDGVTGRELINAEAVCDRIVEELAIFDYLSGGTDTVDPYMRWEWLGNEGAFEEYVKPACIEELGQEFLDRYWSEENGFDRERILSDKAAEKERRRAAHERTIAAGAQFSISKCDTAMYVLLEEFMNYFN